MRVRSMSGVLSCVVGAALIVTAAVAGASSSQPICEETQSKGVPADPAGKVVQGPSTPKPTEGKPKGEKPTGSAPRGTPPTEIPGPVPKDGRPLGAPPSIGVPSSEAPTAGTPNPNKPDAIPGPKPAESKPSGKKPDAIPGPIPSVGNPKNPAPDNGKPSGPAPAGEVKVKGLLTVSDSELQALLKSGFSLGDVIQADRLAATGAGTAAELLQAHAAGTDWTELAQRGHAAPPTAAELSKWLADPKNTQLRATVEAIGQPAGLSVDQMLNLMGDQFNLTDLRTAISIALASGRSVPEVLALKTPDKDWGDLVKHLKPGKQ